MLCSFQLYVQKNILILFVEQTDDFLEEGTLSIDSTICFIKSY